MSDRTQEQAAQGPAPPTEPRGGPEPAPEPERVRDTRQVLRGVQVHTGEGLVTFGPGQEDELERLLTPEDVLRLKGRGAISGGWRARGKKMQPMTNSPEATGTPRRTGRRQPPPEGATVPAEDHRAAVAEVERLRAENERLRREREDDALRRVAVQKLEAAQEGDTARQEPTATPQPEQEPYPPVVEAVPEETQPQDTHGGPEEEQPRGKRRK